MAAQLPPAASHWCHWCVIVAAEPENVAGVSVSTCPTAAVPVIAGSDVFAGATAVVTTAVCWENASSEPPSFVAVTLTLRVCPMSPATIVYVVPLAPAMSTHEPPIALHCCHWTANVIVGVPD